MYLKTLEIVGYKSFAGKTRVDLEPGITAIVGPNGCGKSNIMESVRWCLGEMSWKSLRADSMVDVIFAGTALKPAMGMTEVNLTFDNSKNLLPTGFSEVAVSRRIHRSGESEYFLNKIPCRLRDIREMFLDTGVGGEGYAIIDQGGVEFVLNSKPEDRRSLFEEAAGVAKYRAKREEALRKLERVDADMARLADSVVLITEQVKKLDSDARKAKLYQKYKEELATLEAAFILQQLDAAEAELAAIAARQSPLQESLGSRAAALTAQGATLAAVNLERAREQNLNFEAQQKMSEAKSLRGRLEERRDQAKASQADFKDGQKRSAAEMAAAEARLAALDPELSSAREALSEARKQLELSREQISRAVGRDERLKSELIETERALSDARGDFLKNEEAAQALRRALNEQESSRTRFEMDLRRALRDLEKESRQAQTYGDEVRRAAEEFKAQQSKLESCRQEHASAAEVVVQLKADLESLTQEQFTLHADLAQARSKTEFLESSGQRHAYWAGAQAVINAGLPGIVGMVRQVLSVPEAAKPHLEDVLGERLYALICEDSDAARGAIEFLRGSGAGRARFLVLSSLPESSAERRYPEQSRPLFKQISCDKHPAVEKAVRYLLEESYILGKALYGEHWVFGGAEPKESLQIDLSEINEWRGKAVELEQRRASLEGDKALRQSRLTQSEENFNAAGQSLHAALAQEQLLKSRLSQSKDSTALALQGVDLATAESAQFLCELALVKERRNELGGKLQAAQDEQNSGRARQENLSAALGVFKEEWARREGAQNLLKAAAVDLAGKVSYREGDVKRLEADKDAFGQARLRQEEEISQLGRRISEAKSRETQSSQELERIHAELADLETKAQACAGRLAVLERDIAAKEGDIKKLKDEERSEQEELHQLELEASGQKSRGEMLRNRLWDEWKLSWEEARAKQSASAPVVEQEKIEFLRKRVAALGNVNMAAPEEYEALFGRQTFLTAQIQDLGQAKEDLKSAIAKINASTRENFRQTFSEVREHFRRLYGVLFEGGEADLVLTDPENLLETGVDIVAQPPGKRLQHLSLLSGGEKTLTAIALLFAFFMVKPSPFCMLDEADAALDDANIQRFVSLLKEFEARTQFLIVSHNKRTMEAAGVIYGVTMEEMGVSQIVSVDFHKKDASNHPAPTAEPQSSSIV